ncbi:hypothetical protein [Hymenobacter terricola]|uniref:hypothetical protein n=1 Tax=Hymenobacter terricola TaxID=2819236 RepID=UPI001B30DB2A|nr:hypothetical protein [Hymenobacter terricola]
MPVSLERIERLKVITVSAAREGNSIVFDDPDYAAIRRELLADAEQKKRLPTFILACTNLREVRQEMQGLNSGTAGYKERERFIRESFTELLTEFVTVQRDPFTEVVASTDLSKLGTLPLDIQQKGKEGADCFVYLFCIENSIREFIAQVAVGRILTVPGRVQTKIDARKQVEATRKYLPVRGNSDVYYCDFIELADIIKANWDVFAQHFPGKNEHWFTSMLEELYAVRLLIGHNSAVGEVELKQLDVFYRVIMSYLKLDK